MSQPKSNLYAKRPIENFASFLLFFSPLNLLVLFPPPPPPPPPPLLVTTTHPPLFTTQPNPLNNNNNKKQLPHFSPPVTTIASNIGAPTTTASQTTEIYSRNLLCHIFFFFFIGDMYRDVSSCNTYNYGDSVYWDARYMQEGGSFDWYQRYAALRPFVRKYIPPSSRVLMVGCGNAVMSEDMVNDGYEDIMNIDISAVAIDMMRKKHEYIPQLKYMQMDVRDMSFFPDDSFDGVIDKGTLDSLMCGTDAPISAAQMLAEVCRLLKPGGTYLLITYGDPTVRMPHLRRPMYNWRVTLYNIPRPGFQKPESCSSSRKSFLEPIPLDEKGLIPKDWVLEDPDSHYIYVCRKMDDAKIDDQPTYLLMADVL